LVDWCSRRCVDDALFSQPLSGQAKSIDCFADQGLSCGWRFDAGRRRVREGKEKLRSNAVRDVGQTTLASLEETRDRDRRSVSV